MSTSWQQHTFALTGSIGSGKSSAAMFFKELGALVISADELAHRVLAKDTEGLAAVVKEFGSDVLLKNGELNRKHLADIVFADVSRRKALEAITHPQIQKLAAAEFEKLGGRTAPLAVYDVPLFFEAGLDKLGFKGSIVVSASESECLNRVMERDQITLLEAKTRLKSQLPINEKAKKADYVLDNSGSLDSLKIQVKDLFEKLKTKS